MASFQHDRSSASTTAIAVAAAIVSGTIGYYLGLYASLRQSGGAGDDSEDEDDIPDPAELKTFPGDTEECKLVLVARTDLGMTRGKIAAQCSHATLACYKALIREDPAHPLLKRWERLGQAKVALKVDSEEDMLVLEARAVSVGLNAQVIHDAGRTQIASGSATVLGIGPAPKSKIDEITGHLKLL